MILTVRWKDGRMGVHPVGVESVQTGEADGSPVLFWTHKRGTGAIDLGGVLWFTVRMSDTEVNTPNRTEPV